MALPPQTPLVLLSAIVGSAVALFVWQFRDRPGAKPLTAFLVAASLWSLSDGVVLVSPSLGTKVFCLQVGTAASAVIPLAWLATALAYAGHEWSLSPRRLAALGVEPLVFVALVWTNGREGPVWTDLSTDVSGSYVVLSQEPGLAMWAHLTYSYLLVAAGAFVLVRLNFRTSRFFRSQATALLVAISVPAVAVGVSVFGLVPPHLASTSLAFVVSGVAITGSLLRGKLFEVTPGTREIGRDTVIDELDDRVVILDDDRVVDVNPAAARLFDIDPDAVVGEHVGTASAPLAEAIADLDGGSGELRFDGPEGVRYYDVRVSQLYRGYGVTAGRVVSLRDVTDRRQREQRLDVLNRLLRHNIRNELNVVHGNAELLRHSIDPDGEVDERLDRIETTAQTVVDRSEKVGRISRALEGCSNRRLDLRARLTDLTDGLEAAHEVTFYVDVPEVTVEGGSPLERALEELLENAAKHAGESPTVRVTASRRDDGYVELRVADDGPGIADQERAAIETGRETDLEHGSGVGLWLVNWVVQESGGTLAFDDATAGCTVVVRLPVADDQSTEAPETAEASD